MRFLADENIASQLVKALRAENWDIAWIAETAPSISDQAVIQIAKADRRILLTADIELASITLREPQSAVPTILLRMGNTLPAEFASILINTLKQRNDWNTIHAVLTPQKLRARSLLTIE
jgi:predicted nuclease of predicted toxin-antitoxin system